MTTPNHYDTLGIRLEATQAEIKQAYRRLVKLVHPDSHPPQENPDQIVQVNAAYEVLGDPQRRQFYNQQLYAQRPIADSARQAGKSRYQRAAEVHQRYQQQRQTGQDIDEHLEVWLKQVFTPVIQRSKAILESLQEEIDQLAADPFDDQLMGEFQDYLADCRQLLSYAQRCFRSMPNPGSLAGAAAHLYYCLDRIGDGIEELEYFTFNYDEHYLHTGQELFRIAFGLSGEAEDAVKHLT